MKRFVIDNSIVCGWLLENQATAYSQKIATTMQGVARALAPALLKLEYCNVLRTACKRQLLVATQAHERLELLAELPIDFDLSAPKPELVFDLALRFDLSSYDAAYLDLALRHALPIATQDAALARAAIAAGVGVFKA